MSQLAQNNLIKYKNFLLKTKEGKSFFAEMILLQILCNLLILSIIILNLKKKISDYLNFNSKILNFLGFRFVVPFSSYDQNGFLLFKIILSSFILVIFNQIIKSRFDYHISLVKENTNKFDKLENSQEQINKKINKKSRFLLPLVSSILILSLSDIIRDLAGHFEYNIQNVLMNMPMTLKALIIINVLKFFMSGLKRLLKIFDSQFQNKKNQNEDKTNLREKLTYFHNLFFITLIPNFLTVGFLILIKDFSEKTYFNLSINIGNINFTFLKNIKNGLISLILFKFIVDFIEQFIDFNNDPEKNYKSFYQELTCQRDQDIPFNELMKEWKKRKQTGISFENFIKEFYQVNQLKKLNEFAEKYLELNHSTFEYNASYEDCYESTKQIVQSFNRQKSNLINEFNSQKEFIIFEDFMLKESSKIIDNLIIIEKKIEKKIFENFNNNYGDNQKNSSKIKFENQQTSSEDEKQSDEEVEVENTDNEEKNHYSEFFKRFVSEKYLSEIKHKQLEIYNVEFKKFVTNFMNSEKEEKSARDFKNEWKKRLNPGKAFREIFIKEFKIPLNKKSFLFCLGKSILGSLILSLVFNVNVSFENFFLKNKDQIQNILNDYKFQIIFVLSFSIICGIFCQIIKYESAFEKEKISNQEIHTIINQEDNKGFEIFGLSFREIFSKT